MANKKYVKFWTGTKQQYDAISPKIADTLYFVEGYGIFKGSNIAGLPVSTSAMAGKVLTVSDNGMPVWGDAGSSSLPADHVFTPTGTVTVTASDSTAYSMTATYSDQVLYLTQTAISATVSMDTETLAHQLPE